MTTESTLRADLIERVGKATGGDRALDVDIAWTLEPQRYGAAYWNARTGLPGTTLPKKLDGLGAVAVQRNCPSFTSSIDASLSLVERMLPGVYWIMSKGRTRPDEPLYACELLREGTREEYLGIAEGPTLPLVIILALLRAISAAGAA